MAISPRSYHLLKFVLPISVLLFITAFFLSSSSRSPIANSGWGAYADPPVGNEEDAVVTPVNALHNQGIAGKKAAFIREAADWEIDGSFDQRPLHGICAAAKWRPGLIVDCQASFGGVGNVRNTMLTCVRYAIEAGGWFSPHVPSSWETQLTSSSNIYRRTADQSP